MKKGQAEKRPGLLGEMAHNKLPGTGVYFPCSFFEVAAQPPCVAHKPQVPTP